MKAVTPFFNAAPKSIVDIAGNYGLKHLQDIFSIVGGPNTTLDLVDIDMTLEQMLCFRPLPELANYKTPIENLYLTGAGTHPGGSISGLPGRNCAKVFLHAHQPLRQTFKDAGDSIKSTVASVFGRE